MNTNISNARKFIKWFCKYQQNSSVKTIDGNINAICNGDGGIIIKFYVDKDSADVATVTKYVCGNNKISSEVEIGKDYNQFVQRVVRAIFK